LDVFLFITAHTAYGASVVALVDAFGTRIEPSALFDFSLGNSVHDMWQAGVYPLALLILVFSGIWPYVKAIFILLCWFLNETILSMERRASCITWLHVLGKWSLVDNYVLVLMMVAFQFELGTPNHLKYLPADFLFFEVTVLPGWGIFGFLLAAVLQILLTHYLMITNRKDHKSLAPRIPCSHESYESFGVSNSSLDQPPVPQCTLTWVSCLVVSSLMICSLGSTVAGCFLPSFYFRFEGLAGFVWGDSHSIRTFSLLSIAQEVYDRNIFLWIVFFFFAVVAPILQLLCVVILWFVPLTAKQRIVFVHIVELCMAFNALDVFLVSVIAALYELQQFAGFIVGDRCDSINSFLSRYLHGAFGAQDTCFDVIARLEPTCWVLMLGVLSGLFSSSMLCRLHHKTHQSFKTSSSSLACIKFELSSPKLRHVLKKLGLVNVISITSTDEERLHEEVVNDLNQ
jgi:hypothetical protein